MAADDRRARLEQRVRGAADRAARFRGHVRTPVRQDEQRVRLGQRIRRAEGDAWALRARRVLGWMIREADDRQTVDDNRGARPLEIGAGADHGDPSRVEVGERVEQRTGPEVERVVVRKRDAVDSELSEDLRGPGRSAEVEDTPGPRLAPCRDAALEVEQEEIRLPDNIDELRGDERVMRVLSEPRGNAAPEHRVAGERELHPVMIRSAPAVTTTLPIALGSCARFPFSVASTFQGAPRRIQKRVPAKRAVWPRSSMRS